MPKPAYCIIVIALSILTACPANADPKPISFKEKLTHTRDNVPVSIPKSWGDLVFVTASPGLPYTERLYFQGKDGTIRMIDRIDYVGIQSNKDYEIEVIVLPRQ
jgi:hypothetical protein